MKRSLSFGSGRQTALVVAGTCLIAGTYGLVRLAYGLFLPDIQASVSMGSAAAGYVSTGASVAYCVGALAGLAAARRPRLLVIGAASTATIGSVGMALAPSMQALVPSVVLASMGAGLASPGLVAIIERNLPPTRLDRGQATVNAGTGPGLVAAGLLALVLTQWRLGFVIAATFTGVAGLCVLLLDRRGRSLDRPAPTSADLSWLPALAVPATAALLLGTASAAVWTYGRSHLVASGASDSASTVAWIAIGVGGTATVVTARLLSEHPAPRAWLLTTSAVAVAIAALGLSPDRYPVATLACGLFGWGFVAASSALIAWTALVVPDRAAAGTSVLFVALILGQGAGSAAAGALSGPIGLPATFLLAAVACVGAAACSLRTRSEERPTRCARPAPSSRHWCGARPGRSASGPGGPGR